MSSQSTPKRQTNVNKTSVVTPNSNRSSTTSSSRSGNEGTTAERRLDGNNATKTNEDLSCGNADHPIESQERLEEIDRFLRPSQCTTLCQRECSSLDCDASMCFMKMFVCEICEREGRGININASTGAREDRFFCEECVDYCYDCGRKCCSDCGDYNEEEDGHFCNRCLAIRQYPIRMWRQES